MWEKEIYLLIKESENIDSYTYYCLYHLLEDPSYLETAYNKIQETADNLEPDVKEKFLNYPIPKAIIKGYNKVFKN